MSQKIGQALSTFKLRFANTFARACLACLVFGPISGCAQIALPSSGDIDIVAGDIGAGYSGDAGPATSAALSYPNGVAVDSSGNLYIADTGNSRIRKVTASTGYISTAVGNGTSGYSGDGAAATSAELNAPRGVAVDASGNIYIADTGNNVVRKVAASTGYISTIAGDGTSGYSGDAGPAASAKLQSPSYIALDSSGDVYITDTGNTRVRVVLASTGYIYTIAGGGSGCNGLLPPYDGCLATDALLDLPLGIAVDSSGNLFITDGGYCEIREVALSTGYIYGVAGNTSCGFFGDGGAATSAELNGPFDVALDSYGNMYITDNGNYRIRKVDVSTGYISTIAGNGVPSYAGDGGSATSAELNNPQVLTVDSSGYVYLLDNSWYSVVRAIAP